METLPVAHQNVFVSLRAFDTGGGRYGVSALQGKFGGDFNEKNNP